MENWQKLSALIGTESLFLKFLIPKSKDNSTIALFLDEQLQESI